jgi:hypothetical protein
MEPLDLPIADPIDLKTASYFPSTWRLVALIFTIAGILIAFVNVFVGITIAIGGVLVVTTHYRIEVDFNRGTYRDYTWIVGIKSGETARFDRIEYIFINKNKVSQTLSGHVTSANIRRYDYNGYLKFSETQKIHLRSDESKTKLVRHMQFIAARLNCPLHDYSED